MYAHRNRRRYDNKRKQADTALRRGIPASDLQHGFRLQLRQLQAVIDDGRGTDWTRKRVEELRRLTA